MVRNVLNVMFIIPKSGWFVVCTCLEKIPKRNILQRPAAKTAVLTWYYQKMKHFSTNTESSQNRRKSWVCSLKSTSKGEKRKSWVKNAPRNWPMLTFYKIFNIFEQNVLHFAPKSLHFAWFSSKIGNFWWKM